MLGGQKPRPSRGGEGALLSKEGPAAPKIDSRAICQKIIPIQSDSAFALLVGGLRSCRNSH